MRVNEDPKSYLIIPTYYLLVLIHVNQVGIGFLGFQRIIFKEAGHDAWMSILIASVFTIITTWIMVITLQGYSSADLYGIHYEVFGKWLGMILSSVYILYLTIATVVVLRNYVEMIQSWIFPTVGNWLLSSVILFLLIYCLLGGFRVVVGFCFLAYLFTVWLVFLLYYPFQMANWDNIFPILEATPKALLMGAKEMTITIIGFEILYFLYPYLSEKKKVARFAFLGIILTTLVYLLVMLCTILIMAEADILRTIWASLSLLKLIQMPFLERFEILGVSMTLWIILPNMMLFLWAASRGMKRVFGWKQKHAVYVLSLVVFCITLLLKSRLHINMLNDWLSTYSFYLIYIYPLILLASQKIMFKWRGRKG